MKIKYWMTKNPVTIDPEAPITDAARLMKGRGFRRLPVVEGGKLVGLVTYHHIVEAQPSPVSTLSRHEARYLVAKVKVRDVMRKNPVTVSPDDDVMNALLEGNRLGIGSYPVMSEDRLVGIITATDLFKLFVELLGVDNRADFLYLAGHDGQMNDPAYLGRLQALLAGHGIAVLSYLTFPPREITEPSVVLLKVSPGRRQEALEVLTAGGFQTVE